MKRNLLFIQVPIIARLLLLDTGQIDCIRSDHKCDCKKAFNAALKEWESSRKDTLGRLQPIIKECRNSLPLVALIDEVKTKLVELPNTQMVKLKVGMMQDATLLTTVEQSPRGRRVSLSSVLTKNFCDYLNI